MLDHLDLPIPELPAAAQGLHLAHLTDLHIRRPRRRYRQMAQCLAQAQPDLLLLTGDYMTKPGDEPVTLAVLEEFCKEQRVRLGIFAVFGNHDTPLFRQMAQDLPIHWLENGCQDLPELGLQLCGLHSDSRGEPDVPALLWALGQAAASRDPAAGKPPVRLLLCHKPDYIASAADLGADVMFSGHTHGGQWRLPGGRALKNCSDLPLRLTSGLLRHRDTLCAVSRGVGEVRFDIRIFCPPQIPVYRLVRGPTPGQRQDDVVNVQPW